MINTPKARPPLVFEEKPLVPVVEKKRKHNASPANNMAIGGKDREIMSSRGVSPSRQIGKNQAC